MAYFLTLRLDLVLGILSLFCPLNFHYGFVGLSIEDFMGEEIEKK